MRQFVVATLLFFPTAGFAGTAPSIKDCALLLPQGEKYTYTIQGTVDRTQGTSLKQTITIKGTQTSEFTPNEQQPVEAQAKTEGEAKFGRDTGPFKQCLDRVLGNDR